jgi:hypothetical protein
VTVGLGLDLKNGIRSDGRRRHALVEQRMNEG